MPWSLSTVNLLLDVKDVELFLHTRVPVCRFNVASPELVTLTLQDLRRVEWTRG